MNQIEKVMQEVKRRRHRPTAEGQSEGSASEEEARKRTPGRVQTASASARREGDALL